MKEKVINRKTTIKKEHNWITMKFTGILVIQIKWRGKTYVGALTDRLVKGVNK